MHYFIDRYYGEDILVHEFSHGIDLTRARVKDPAWPARLSQIYQNAITKGRWTNTYAASNQNEYFAEGVQSFFDVNTEADPPNGIHNFVNTRAELKLYDPELYDLIREVFPVELSANEGNARLMISHSNENSILIELSMLQHTFRNQKSAIIIQFHFCISSKKISLKISKLLIKFI